MNKAEQEVLLVTFGSAGDVNPVVAIGRELKNRGYKTTIITNGYFAEMVRSFDLDFIEISSKEEYLSAINNPLLWHPRKAFPYIAKTSIIPGTRSLLDLLKMFDKKKTTVVATTLVLGARIAQEAFAMPLISLHLQPAVIRSIFETPAAGNVIWPDGFVPIKRLLFGLVDRFLLDPPLREINKIRAGFGFKPTRSLFGSWLHSKQKVIGLFPSWFAKPQADWPKNTTLTGFVSLPSGELDPHLDRFLTKKPLVFTAGSAMLHSDEFFQTALKVSEKIGRPALLIGPNVPAELPTNALTARYVPLDKVLPRCAAIVHHGGIGTSAQAMKAGLPQLVMPMSHDQLDNAIRLKKLGVADWIWPKNFKVNAVESKLNSLFSENIQKNCQKIAGKIDFDHYLAQTCDEIEGFIQQNRM